eukprot:6179583-Pleurochrysis_carterae.AAC.2
MLGHLHEEYNPVLSIDVLKLRVSRILRAPSSGSQRCVWARTACSYVKPSAATIGQLNLLPLSGHTSGSGCSCITGACQRDG